MQNCLKIVVAGDVDAGKSTLIGRFLYDSGSLPDGAIGNIEESCRKIGNDLEFAYLLDSLEEEREKQLTIDTTQVFCRDKKGREWVFIDVPGHRELLKNMLVGSTCADAAVLVIDAQRSLTEQTKRHLQILKFLGIRRFIIVINKMDIAGYNERIFLEERKRISDFLHRIDIKPEYCIPVAAKHGDNLFANSRRMSWYKGKTLIEALIINCHKHGGRNFRMPVQDVYKLNGKDIIAGRVIAGRIKSGERVVVLPSNKEARVKQIMVFKQNVPAAGSPENIGLILDNSGGLARGMILAKPKLPDAQSRVSARIFCVHPLKINENLRFKSTTQDVAAHIGQIDTAWDSADLEARPKTDLLRELELAEVVIAAKHPVVTEKFEGLNSLGRFVLENEKREICAVGIIS